MASLSGLSTVVGVARWTVVPIPNERPDDGVIECSVYVGPDRNDASPVTYRLANPGGLLAMADALCHVRAIGGTAFAYSLWPEGSAVRAHLLMQCDCVHVSLLVTRKGDRVSILVYTRLPGADHDLYRMVPFTPKIEEVERFGRSLREEIAAAYPSHGGSRMDATRSSQRHGDG